MTVRSGGITHKEATSQRSGGDATDQTIIFGHVENKNSKLTINKSINSYDPRRIRSGTNLLRKNINNSIVKGIRRYEVQRATNRRVSSLQLSPASRLLICFSVINRKMARAWDVRPKLQNSHQHTRIFEWSRTISLISLFVSVIFLDQIRSRTFRSDPIDR